MGTASTIREHRRRDGQQIYPAPVPSPVEDVSEPREHRVTRGVVSVGSVIDAVAGMGGMVVAIVGITGVRPLTLAAVATIALGVALLFQGGSIAARWPDMKRHFDGDVFDRTDIAGGIGTEMFGGLAGIVLGVVALAGVYPLVLLPAAAIVFGFALLLGGAAQPELADVELIPFRSRRRRRSTHDAVEASGGVMVMTGLAAGVLGLLALLGVGPILTLVLVAMLCVGAAEVIAGGALTARFARQL